MTWLNTRILQLATQFTCVMKQWHKHLLLFVAIAHQTRYVRRIGLILRSMILLLLLIIRLAVISSILSIWCAAGLASAIVESWLLHWSSIAHRIVAVVVVVLRTSLLRVVFRIVCLNSGWSMLIVIVIVRFAVFFEAWIGKAPCRG